MLYVQQYLSRNSLDTLKETYGINYKFNDDNRLVQLDYDQIRSDKLRYDPIVKECRGLILEVFSWDIIAKGFDRFRNLNEIEHKKETFNWKNYKAYNKEDGSLILLYNYQGEWRVNTRLNFCSPFTCHQNDLTEDIIQNTEEYVDKYKFSFYTEALKHIINTVNKNQGANVNYDTLPKDTLNEYLSTLLNPNYTYTFEYCSKYNRIVTLYEESKLFLLGIYDNKRGGLEKPINENNINESLLCLKVSEVTSLKNQPLDKVHEYINYKTKEDPFYEGLVLRDNTGFWLKVKSDAYRNIHRIRTSRALFDATKLHGFVKSGIDSGINQERIKEIIKQGNDHIVRLCVRYIYDEEKLDRVIKLFPTLKSKFNFIKSQLKNEINTLERLWNETHHIAEQKEFALAIQDKALLYTILFDRRNSNGDLRYIWENNQERIYKKVVSNFVL